MSDLAGLRALVTGASSGIGAAISHELAARGVHLVLTARRRDALDAVAGELSAHGVRTDVIPADLGVPGATRLLWLTATATGPIDIIVNNAGFGYFRAFTEVEATRDAELVQLNIASLVELTRLFIDSRGLPPAGSAAEGRRGSIDSRGLPPAGSAAEGRRGSIDSRGLPPAGSAAEGRRGSIDSRGSIDAKHGKPGRGYILNVGSIGAYQSVPNMALYAASKAFVRNFTEGLHDELRGTALSATCLSPGGTRTAFHAAAGAGNYSWIANASMMSAEAVARIGVRAMVRGKRNAIPGLVNKLSCWGVRFVPRSVASWLARRVLGKPSRALPARSAAA